MIVAGVRLLLILMKIIDHWPIADGAFLIGYHSRGARPVSNIHDYMLRFIPFSRLYQGDLP
jgi:hypothetical protein